MVGRIYWFHLGQKGSIHEVTDIKQMKNDGQIEQVIEFFAVPKNEGSYYNKNKSKDATHIAIGDQWLSMRSEIEIEKTKMDQMINQK